MSSNRDDIDFSVIRAAIEHGSAEVRCLLLDDCRLIIECKACRALFRALPLFIAHKRVYCTKSTQMSQLPEIETRYKTEAAVIKPTAAEGKKHPPLQPVNRNKTHKESANQLVQAGKAGASSEYKSYSEDSPLVEKRKEATKAVVLQLNPIPTNKNAMMVTLLDGSGEKQQRAKQNSVNKKPKMDGVTRLEMIVAEKILPKCLKENNIIDINGKIDVIADLKLSKYSATKDNAIKGNATKESTTKASAKKGNAKKDNITKDSTTKGSATKDSATKDSGTKGSATKDSTTKDNATKENATKENATKDSATKDSGTKDSGTKGSATKDSTTKGCATKDSTTKGSATKENATKDSGTKGSATKDSGTKGSTTKDSATKGNATKDNTIKGSARKDNATNESVTKDSARKDNATNDNATKESATKGNVTKDGATKESAIKDTARRDNATKGSAIKESATKYSATKESATMDSALKESATKGSAIKERATKESATMDSALKESATKGSAIKESATKASATKARATKANATKGSATKDSAIKESARKGSNKNGSASKISATKDLKTKLDKDESSIGSTCRDDVTAKNSEDSSKSSGKSRSQGPYHRCCCGRRFLFKVGLINHTKKCKKTEENCGESVKPDDNQKQRDSSADKNRSASPVNMPDKNMSSRYVYICKRGKELTVKAPESSEESSTTDKRVKVSVRKPSVNNAKKIGNSRTQRKRPASRQFEMSHDYIGPPQKQMKVIEDIWVDKVCEKPIERVYANSIYAVETEGSGKLQYQVTRKLCDIADELNLECLVCLQEFTSVSNLRRHAIRHLGWKQYKCKVCRFSSYNKSECNTHILRTHSEKLRSAVSTDNMIVDLNKQACRPRSQEKNQTLRKACETERKDLTGSHRKYQQNGTPENSDRERKLVTAPKRKPQQQNSRPPSNSKKGAAIEENVPLPQTTLNISTRKSPRKVDTRLYREVDQMTTLNNRKAFYSKASKSENISYPFESSLSEETYSSRKQRRGDSARECFVTVNESYQSYSQKGWYVEDTECVTDGEFVHLSKGKVVKKQRLRAETKGMGYSSESRLTGQQFSGSSKRPMLKNNSSNNPDSKNRKLSGGSSSRDRSPTPHSSGSMMSIQDVFEVNKPKPERKSFARSNKKGSAVRRVFLEGAANTRNQDPFNSGEAASKRYSSNYNDPEGNIVVAYYNDKSV